MYSAGSYIRLTRYFSFYSIRDLKPDNILLSEHGHAHLTDFNIAVQFSDSKPLTSVAGSLAYMGPEILQKRGYFASVDWWSLGVVCYELLVGKVISMNQGPKSGIGDSLILPVFRLFSVHLEGRLTRPYNKQSCTTMSPSLNQAMCHKKPETLFLVY